MATYRGTDGNDDFDQETNGGDAYNRIKTFAGDDRVRIVGGSLKVDMGEGSDRLVIDYSGLTDGHFATLQSLVGNGVKGYSGDIDVNTFPATHVRFSGVESFTILTGDATDTLMTGDGDDVLSAGAGDDRLVAGQGEDAVDGGSGTDTLSISFADEQHGVTVDLSAQGEQASGGSDSIANIESFEGDVVGTAFADTFIEGLYGYDATFRTGAGDDLVQIARGSDTADLGDGRDRLVVDYSGQAGYIFQEAPTGNLKHGYSGSIITNGGPAVTFAGVEDFTISGSTAGDMLRAGDGDDVLAGLDGDDVLSAGGGADLLIGGLGRDVLTGGAGADVFRYAASGDSKTIAGDEIVDFSHRQADRIDLSAIDADRTTTGDQHFAFIGQSAFSGHAGELRYAISDGNTVVSGDTNGDHKADFAIQLDGAITLKSGDFILETNASHASGSTVHGTASWNLAGLAGEELHQHLCIV